MRKQILHLFILATFLVALSSTILFGCSNENQEVKVIILSGQSNMVGITSSLNLEQSIGSKKYNEFVNGYDNIQLYSAIDNEQVLPFQKYKLGVGAHENSFGVELGLCDVLNEKCPKDKFYIIKCAYGGSSLHLDWSKNGQCYPKLIENVNNALSDLTKSNKTPKIVSFCWMQGETDNGSYGEYYYENLIAFKNNLTEDFSKYLSDNNLNFVDASIKDDGDVNNAKLAFSQLNQSNYFINTHIDNLIEEGINGLITSGGVHYNDVSELKLGQLFGNCIVDNILK
ncbi:MAG: sialate O-acetylesterase [Eubacteriales bacterium]|nr:sialate O-acetylesterase [Eubacteriales bacterium]